MSYHTPRVKIMSARFVTALTTRSRQEEAGFVNHNSDRQVSHGVEYTNGDDESHIVAVSPSEHSISQ